MHTLYINFANIIHVYQQGRLCAGVNEKCVQSANCLSNPMGIIP